jgi:hypothetical protein
MILLILEIIASTILGVSGKFFGDSYRAKRAQHLVCAPAQRDFRLSIAAHATHRERALALPRAPPFGLARDANHPSRERFGAENVARDRAIRSSADRRSSLLHRVCGEYTTLPATTRRAAVSDRGRKDRKESLSTGCAATRYGDARIFEQRAIVDCQEGQMRPAIFRKQAAQLALRRPAPRANDRVPLLRRSSARQSDRSTCVLRRAASRGDEKCAATSRGARPRNHNSCNARANHPQRP